MNFLRGLFVKPTQSSRQEARNQNAVTKENEKVMLSPALQVNINILFSQKNQELVKEQIVDVLEQQKEQLKVSKNRCKLADDPESEAQWFNLNKETVKFKELKGSIKIFKFWTYCCINCLQIIEEVKKMEEEYEDKGVLFIGVHSGKFANEKKAENIRSAIIKYGITHPCVNDSDRFIWNQVGSKSWPFFAVVDPNNRLLFSLSGSSKTLTKLKVIIEAMLIHYKNEIQVNLPFLVELESEKIKNEEKILSYPGGIALDKQNNQLFISDSANHQILQCKISQNKPKLTILQAIGKKHDTNAETLKFADGSLEECQFNNPQGISYHFDHKSQERLLLVADTNNQSVRIVNLSTRTVSTVFSALQPVILLNPWHVVPCTFSYNDSQIIYLISMAGQHQIWAIDDHLKAFVISGTGAESKSDSSDLLKVTWAQPSGLAFCNETQRLIIADSESSTVRQICFDRNSPDFGSKTLVGGSNLDDDLFAFGDADGEGIRAKLQHPLSVVFTSKEEVMVADTYNHKIKSITLSANPAVKTLSGSGSPGHMDGSLLEAQFNEPQALTFDSETKSIYVCDTNNSSIRLIDLKTSKVSTLTLTIKQASLPVEDINEELDESVKLSAKFLLAPDSATSEEVSLHLVLPSEYHFNVKAPSKWWTDAQDYWQPATGKFIFDEENNSVKIVANVDRSKNGSHNIHVHCRLYVCIEDTCITKEISVDCSFAQGTPPVTSISITLPK